MSLPQQNLENLVLGHCLNAYGAVHQVAAIIHKAEVFLDQDNQRVYGVMLHLMRHNNETDIVAVTNELIAQHGLTSSLSLPWIAYVSTLVTSGKFFAGNLEYLCYELVKDAVKRSLNQEASRMFRELSYPTANPLDVLDTSLERLELIRGRLHELREVPFPESYVEVVKQTELAAKSGNPITGLSTGLTKLDGYLKGLQPSTFTVIAARPSMGKTGQVCQMTYNMAHLQGIPVGFFSLEMKKRQLAGRYLAIDSRLKNAEVISGMDRYGNPVAIDRLWASAGELSNAPLYVYDDIFDIDHIVSKCKQLVRERKIKAVFIDYLQLIEMDENLNDTARVGRASRKLKKLSGTLDIPVVALAQLSRKVEERENRRPQLSDLNHSGSIEQDADNVVFMMRPGYYFAHDPDGNPVDDMLLLNIIAKNRNGSTHNDQEAIQLSYDRSTNRIWDYDTNYPGPNQLDELPMGNADVF